MRAYLATLVVGLGLGLDERRRCRPRWPPLALPCRGRPDRLARRLQIVILPPAAACVVAARRRAVVVVAMVVRVAVVVAMVVRVAAVVVHLRVDVAVAAGGRINR